MPPCPLILSGGAKLLYQTHLFLIISSFNSSLHANKILSNLEKNLLSLAEKNSYFCRNSFPSITFWRRAHFRAFKRDEISFFPRENRIRSALPTPSILSFLRYRVMRETARKSNSLCITNFVLPIIFAPPSYARHRPEIEFSLHSFPPKFLNESILDW